jgi:hypothetical protein
MSQLQVCGHMLKLTVSGFLSFPALRLRVVGGESIGGKDGCENAFLAGEFWTAVLRD